MRTLNYFFLLLFLVLYGCSLDDKSNNGFYPAGEDVQYSKAACHVIYLKPGGNDDTQALTEAFNKAKEYGPGTTIQLSPGTFQIGMIEVRDFDGYITGSGKGKTIIKNVGSLPCETKWQANLIPGLITFVGGNIIVSEMTFRIKDGRACEPGEMNDAIYGDLAAVLIFSDYSATYMPDNRRINGSVHNVDFIAGNDGGFGTYGTEGNVGMTIYNGNNSWTPLEYMPLSTGEIKISNCSFINALCGPDFWGFDQNSKISVERCIMSGGYQQLPLLSLMGTQVTIRNNKFTNGWYSDLFIWGGDMGAFPGVLPAKPTKYQISGNCFDSPAGVVSLFVIDAFRSTYASAVQPQLLDISNNIFKNSKGDLPEENYFGLKEKVKAIQALNLKDAFILNNIFLGTAEIGVLVDGDEATNTWAENAKIIANIFCNAKYDEAALLLGPFSKNCKFVGSGTDKLIDNGQNNMIIGTKAFKKIVPFFNHFNIHNGLSPAKGHVLK